jgi:hypothetical protein
MEEALELQRPLPPEKLAVALGVPVIGYRDVRVISATGPKPVAPFAPNGL